MCGVDPSMAYNGLRKSKNLDHEKRKIRKSQTAPPMAKHNFEENLTSKDRVQLNNLNREHVWDQACWTQQQKQNFQDEFGNDAKTTLANFAVRGIGKDFSKPMERLLPPAAIFGSVIEDEVEKVGQALIGHSKDKLIKQREDKNKIGLDQDTFIAGQESLRKELRGVLVNLEEGSP